LGDELDKVKDSLVNLEKVKFSDVKVDYRCRARYSNVKRMVTMLGPEGFEGHL
jgi:hypothetical protein